MFCRDLRAFVWRKIEPKIVLVERKRQISGMRTQAVVRTNRIYEEKEVSQAVLIRI